MNKNDGGVCNPTPVCYISFMESNTAYIIQTYNANNEACYVTKVVGVTLNLNAALQLANNIVTDIKNDNDNYYLDIESFDADQSLNMEYGCYFITNFFDVESNNKVIYSVSVYKKDITQ
jgi:hypothetical protein